MKRIARARTQTQAQAQARTTAVLAAVLAFSALNEKALNAPSSLGHEALNTLLVLKSGRNSIFMSSLIIQHLVARGQARLYNREA